MVFVHCRWIFAWGNRPTWHITLRPEKLGDIEPNKLPQEVHCPTHQEKHLNRNSIYCTSYHWLSVWLCDYKLLWEFCCLSTSHSKHRAPLPWLFEVYWFLPSWKFNLENSCELPVCIYWWDMVGYRKWYYTRDTLFCIYTNVQITNEQTIYYPIYLLLLVYLFGLFSLWFSGTGVAQSSETYSPVQCHRQQSLKSEAEVICPWMKVPWRWRVRRCAAMVEPVNGHDVHWSPFRQWGAYIAIKTL